jgi:hypothetical protein
MRVRSRWLTTAVLTFAVAGSAPALAAQAQPKPTLVGTYTNWFAYSSGNGAEKVCYVLGQPKSSVPKARRDPIFFLISTWPAKKKLAEPSVVPGYEYKEQSKAEVQIGSDKFPFFTKNDDDAGGAWMETAKDERRLLDAMRRGSSMTVIGTSARGTLTRDTYSLAGITAAIDAANKACK